MYAIFVFGCQRKHSINEPPHQLARRKSKFPLYEFPMYLSRTMCSANNRNKQQPRAAASRCPNTETKTQQKYTKQIYFQSLCQTRATSKLARGSICDLLPKLNGANIRFILVLDANTGGDSESKHEIGGKTERGCDRFGQV